MLVQVLTFSYPAIPTEPPKEGHRGPFDDYNPTVVRPRRITTISLSTLHARNPTYDVRRNGALLVLPDPARQRHVTVLARHYEVERFHLRMRYESGAGERSEAQVHDLPAAAALNRLEAVVPQGLANERGALLDGEAFGVAHEVVEQRRVYVDLVEKLHASRPRVQLSPRGYRSEQDGPMAERASMSSK